MEAQHYSVAIKSDHRKKENFGGKNTNFSSIFLCLTDLSLQQTCCQRSCHFCFILSLCSPSVFLEIIRPFVTWRVDTRVEMKALSSDKGPQQRQTCIFYLEIGFNYCRVNPVMRVAISGCLALLVDPRRSLQATGANLWKTERKSWSATFCRFTAGFYWTTRMALKRHSLSFDEIRLESLFCAYHLCEGKNSQCGN